MNDQIENAHNDHQSFDHYPTAPLYPLGWDLSSLHPTPTIESTSESDDSAENESYQS